MWSPTHTQVTVQRAKGLLTKGKNGTNNCFVTIALGKEKYQTSVKEKAEQNVNWNEECELKIPDQGNRAELMLTCLHRNNLGIDEFLGQVTLPLNEMDVYDRPRSKWFKLESKPGQEKKKNKDRGELEVRICFVVKSGSLTDLSKKDKHKSSIGQLASSVGGSLLSIGTIEKRKGIKKFAKSIGSKMHLNGKKKNKDGDDISSFNGSFASIGTPNSSNGGSRRYGQRAGEADPGVISEDEDEFVFDNLSHKSSASSLNIRAGGGLQPPTQNFAPRQPSPLLGNNNNKSSIGKAGGKQLPTQRRDFDEDLPRDAELEEFENDFSVRARTLPPPSKPPRTPLQQQQQQDAEAEAEAAAIAAAAAAAAAETAKATAAAAIAAEKLKQEQKLDEWETKLYGGHLAIGSSDSLKRRSWELARVPLPSASEEVNDEEEVMETLQEKDEEKEKSLASLKKDEVTSSSSSSSDSEMEEETVQQTKQQPKEQVPVIEKVTEKQPERPQELKLQPSPVITARDNLLSPDGEHNDFNQFNASFAKFEQRNKSKFFDVETDKKWSSQAFIGQESQAVGMPKASPRNREKEADLKKAAEEAEQKRQAEVAAAAAAAAAAAEVERQRQEDQKRRADEDARLEAELHANEQRLREEEEALQEELRQQEEEKRREAKRREEDQRILNFARRSISTEDEKEKPQEQQENETSPRTIHSSYSTPEQSPRELMNNEHREKRMGKFKYLNKRDKNEDDKSPSPKSNERIIIGHEKSATHAERRSEISAALAKKYEGKSREELMLIANGMENEALLQRQRVKELEDYLDNLLLRVMETHPKILQNPYSRTTSAKSFKNYINMNDFL